MAIPFVFTFLFFLNINLATAQDCDTLKKITNNLKEFKDILGDDFNLNEMVDILNDLRDESLTVDTLIKDMVKFGQDSPSSNLSPDEIRRLLSNKYERKLNTYPLSLIHELNPEQLEELTQFNHFRTPGIKTADDLKSASRSYKEKILYLKKVLDDVDLVQYEDLLRNFHNLDNDQVKELILSLERGSFPAIPEQLIPKNKNPAIDKQIISQRNSFISKVQEIFSERARTQYKHQTISRAYPGGAHPTRSKSLVNVDTSVSQIKTMARSGAPGVPDDYARSFIAAVEEDSFAEFFHANRRNSPYTAGAIDPQTGIYSIRKNVDQVPGDLHAVIQDNINDLSQNYATHIAESISHSGTEHALSDGSQHVALQAAGIPGLHAEVLAASDVLTFKKTLKECLSDPSSCSVKFSCFTESPITCNPNAFDHIRFSNEAISKCKENIKVCFPDRETPKDLFFDVRGTNKTTVSQGISPEPTAERFRAPKFNVIAGDSNINRLYKKLKLDINPDRVKIFCQNKTRYINECTKAYRNAINQFCNSQFPICSGKIEGNFDQFMTEAKEALIKTLGNKTSSGNVATRMGAGHRCFNCWHILDRGELESTLIQR